MSALNAASSGDGPTVISTFAGCGGSSLGYKLAGFRELLAVEWDQNAVDTFRLNFPGVPVYHGDIAALTGAECMKLAGIGPGELDVLDGSPPCQGFSTAGKRKFDDPRNSLFKEFARLLNELQPRVFVMENVTGMVKGCMKQAYLAIVATLRACGYRVKGEVLNAMYYNVPQSRERVIIIGVRNDLGIEPSHPNPQTKPMTIREAWLDVPVETPPKLSPKLASIIPRIPVWGDGGDVLGAYFSTKRLSFDQPSRTICKGNVGSRACFVHPSEHRAITGAEVKRIASFPDDFEFVGGYKMLIERIGNSVPPNLMRAIAEHVRKEILDK
jgi:DNA (cytosine-5)-methyltransferase 1